MEWGAREGGAKEGKSPVDTGDEPCVTECDRDVRRDVEAEGMLNPWPTLLGCASGICSAQTRGVSVFRSSGLPPNKVCNSS